MPRIFQCRRCGKPGHFAKTCPQDPVRNLTGRTFDRWTVKGRAPRRDKYIRWICECSCLAKTRREVLEFILLAGESESCGCKPHKRSESRCGNCGEVGHRVTTCPKPRNSSREKKWCSGCEDNRLANEFSPGHSKCRKCCRENFKRSAESWRIDQSPRLCKVCHKIKRIFMYPSVCRSCSQKRTRTRSPLIDRSHHLREIYDIRLEDYDAMLSAQHGRCAICLADRPARSRRFTHFAVDHNHTTDKIRGLLCFDCNRGLGNFKDDPQLLLTAALYLERPRRFLLSPRHAYSNRGVRHRLTQQDLDQLLKEQDSVCAICPSATALHVDHDHQTDEVRGLLCSPCNLALGIFQDSPEILRRAASYLVDPPGFEPGQARL